jgi:hypothetical protein
MPQLVFEFWSQEIEPVVEAIKLILDGHPTENHAAPHSLHYEPVQQGLDWAAQQVYAGHIASFVARPKSGGIRYAMLNGPNIGSDKRPGYMGTIEYTQGDYTNIWNRLLDVDGLKMVCIGSEEGVEFSRDQPPDETFPWDDSFLVIGAVRGRVGEWTIKQGPNYFPALAE